MNRTFADLTHFEKPLGQDSIQLFVVLPVGRLPINTHGLMRCDFSQLFQRTHLAVTVPCFSAIATGNRAVPGTCTCTWLPTPAR